MAIHKKNEPKRQKATETLLKTIESSASVCLSGYEK